MWATLARIVLRSRIIILVLLGMITVFMAYNARFAQLTYELPRLLPTNDSTNIAYESFRKRYGKEETVIVVGIEKNPLNDLELFNSWYELGKRLQHIDGVDTIVSVASIYNLEKVVSAKRFKLKPLVQSNINSQAELDSLSALIYSLPFYKGFLYNDSTNATLMAVSLDSGKFNSANRMQVLDELMLEVSNFGESENIDVHYSGLPFIRTIITNMVKSELGMFVLLAVLITALILFIFFRSLTPIVISMLVVCTGVVWSMGILVLFGYKITILTSLIPPLIIVIGVPNCIFIINKYHNEFRNHGNQAKALTRVIEKIGAATFMTNATTAVGFVTFIFVHSAVLKEFGVIASINIMVIFILAILILPIILSFLAPPKQRHTEHLEKVWILRSVGKLVHIVENHRKIVYVVTAILVVIAAYGINRIETTGNIVDDLAQDHFVSKDLNFFETNFKGVMPFEIDIDAHKTGFATREHTLKKIDELQQLLAEYKVFSKPLSIAEGVKFIRQAYYNGNPNKYQLINRQEKVFFKPYLENATGNNDWLRSFVDSTKQHTRVSVQIADIGTKEMDLLINELQPRIDSILNPEKYTVNLTGTSVVFLKGTNYLIKNLFISLTIAIIFIAMIMALLFSSLRMIIVSLITNFIPLLLTAALMGYFGISIKPSTILVFSIAFGISVDDTIHFLAKYRQELKHYNGLIRVSVIAALKETGVSMIYTSIILFFGFSVFMTSEFGGTMALGLLVSFTLLVAMLANLVLLPSFLLSLERAITTKAFREPLLQILDEEEDIELEALQIKTNGVGTTVSTEVIGGQMKDAALSNPNEN